MNNTTPTTPVAPPNEATLPTKAMPKTMPKVKQSGRTFQRATLFVIWAWLIIFALLPNILVIVASF